jgi:hypothetical protein
MTRSDPNSVATPISDEYFNRLLKVQERVNAEGSFLVHSICENDDESDMRETEGDITLEEASRL